MDIFEQGRRAFVSWYKDRDFLEVKSGNDDVVAYIPNSDQLWRIINSHNILISELEIKDREIKKLKAELEKYV